MAVRLVCAYCSGRFEAQRRREPAYCSVEHRVAAHRERRKRPADRAEVLDFPLADPVGLLVEWSRKTLRVPPGHVRAGEPMELPDYAVRFLREGWEAHESALSTARKNAKSAICAVLALGYLCGPLRTPGWRGAVVSLSLGKADELRRQVEGIALASGLAVEVRRTPYPGTIATASGVLETLSADRASGHASGFDLVLVDETGLFPERSRELLAGLRSSVSAKNGRVVHISIQGDSPLYREILENPETVAHVYEAPAGCALDDEKAWSSANPGLGPIKSREYMEAEVRRVRGAPSDVAFFRAHDLNQRLAPSVEVIVGETDWSACLVDELPAREGRAFVGLDVGSGTSMTAAAVLWPATGRFEAYAGLPAEPDLLERGQHDGAGRLYVEMADRGELTVYPGRVTPVGPFLLDLADALGGSYVAALGADRYRKAEVTQALLTAGLRWPTYWRGTGASATADGSHDVRAFQRWVTSGRLRGRAGLLMAHAIGNSAIRRDPAGNPAIDKQRQRGRIDALSAAVIACGLADTFGEEREPRLVRVS